jgi:hypothetical protein
MAGTRHSSAEKDGILRHAFEQLKARGVGSPWAASHNPWTEIEVECRVLIDNLDFTQVLDSYLRAHTGLRRSVTMLFTFIAMAANARWQDLPEESRGIAARGWFLGRWVPTFLIIDGPIGRFVCGEESPLKPWFGQHYPMLTSARDFLNDRLFRVVRNGFAHWAFDWEVVGSESYIVAYDWERDLPTAKMHQAECDAYHIVAFALVEVLESVFISRRSDPTEA